MLKLVKYRRETMYKRVKNLKSIFINVGCFVWTRWIVEWLLVIPGIVVYLFVVIRSVGWLLKVLGWNCIFFLPRRLEVFIDFHQTCYSFLLMCNLPKMEDIIGRDIDAFFMESNTATSFDELRVELQMSYSELFCNTLL